MNQWPRGCCFIVTAQITAISFQVSWYRVSNSKQTLPVRDPNGSLMRRSIMYRALPNREACERAVSGLLQLHDLTAANDDQSPQADTIRSLLEESWSSLSETERRQITGLSKDLYSITDPPVATLPENPQSRKQLNEATVASTSGDWEGALDLLRRWSVYLPP